MWSKMPTLQEQLYVGIVENVPGKETEEEKRQRK